MCKAIFLDRDGTLILHKGHLGDPSEVELLDGVAQSLISLKESGWQLIVVTNQPGVARGLFTELHVQSVHDRIDALIEEETGCIPISRYVSCYFHPDGIVPQWTGDDPRRKPAPGMLIEVSNELGIDLKASWMIGDAVQDIQAGIHAGCQTVWLRTSHHGGTVVPTCYAPNLATAVPLILANSALHQ